MEKVLEKSWKSPGIPLHFYSGHPEKHRQKSVMIVCLLLQQTKIDGETKLTNKQKQYLKCFPTLWQTNKNIMFRTFFIKKKIFEATC